MPCRVAPLNDAIAHSVQLVLHHPHVWHCVDLVSWMCYYSAAGTWQMQNANGCSPIKDEKLAKLHVSTQYKFTWQSSSRRINVVLSNVVVNYSLHFNVLNDHDFLWWPWHQWKVCALMHTLDWPNVMWPAISMYTPSPPPKKKQSSSLSIWMIM